MHVNLRYVFDLDKMQFIFPTGEPPYGPFKISLVFNGINIDEELKKYYFLKNLLLVPNKEGMDMWERMQLFAAMRNLEEQKNILMQNVLLYLHQFWCELEEMNYKIRCPHCGQLYVINYNIYFEGDEDDEEDEEEGDEEEEDDEEEDVDDYEDNDNDEMPKRKRYFCTSAAG